MKMLIKISSVSSILLVCVLVLQPHQQKCFEIRAGFGYLKDKVIKPIESIFPGKENENTSDFSDISDVSDVSQVKEHGNFDFIGRDIVRETSKKFRQITDKIKRTFSKDTQGLDCNKTLSDGTTESFKSRIRAIYPGTKWCGDGNISRSFSDLGRFSKTDSCCRDHDLCPENMDAGSAKYGLMNTGLFTRSHCECDRKFYECLKDAKSIVADSIGYTYFSILGPQCFQQDYPIVDCVEERRGKCEKYMVDTDGEKMYQWLDSPVF